jgi:hypothetical protein
MLIKKDKIQENLPIEKFRQQRGANLDILHDAYSVSMDRSWAHVFHDPPGTFFLIILFRAFHLSPSMSYPDDSFYRGIKKHPAKKSPCRSVNTLRRDTQLRSPNRQNSIDQYPHFA